MPRASRTVVLFRKLALLSVALSAGNAPPSTRVMMPAVSWHTYSMNRHEASGRRLELSTPSADPPFSAFVRLPCAVGICATRHRPAVPGTSASSSDGIHAPANSDATVPDPSACFQSSDHVSSRVFTRSSSIICCQNRVNSCVPVSVSSVIETSLPSCEVL